jgi:hypothetical protein
MRLLIPFLFLFILLLSCKKADDRTCFKTAGETATLEVPMSPFNQLSLHEHLICVLIQDSTDKVVIKGGRNLLKNVDLSISEGVLKIQNQNRCSFLRSYKKKVTVEIHFTHLQNISYQGTEPMTNKGSLKFDWLTFLISDGAGTVNLTFDAQHVFATIGHGWGNFNFSGNAHYANLNIRSNGYCDITEMNIRDSLTVVSKTQGAVKITADGINLKAQTLSDGNIYYKGKPSKIQFDKYSNGELVALN